MTFRSFLYLLARLLGDISAIRHKQVGMRITAALPAAARGGYWEKYSNELLIKTKDGI